MSPRSLALLLAIPFAIPLSRPAQDANEEEAKKLLLDAEEQAKRGRFALSSQRYRELAKKWPQTEAGRIASERARPSAFLGCADVLRHGPSENRVDVVLLGDGYTLDHQETFETLAGDVPAAFEAQPEYAEYWQYFNFVRAILVSKDDGVDEYGREYDTVLGGRRSGAIQGQVTVDHQQVMTMLNEVPGHDGLAVVFVKLGVLGTGGGGIACIGGGDTTTLIHEFGHAFADLGDEYSSNTGHRGRVGRSANVSDTGDPELVPWRHWIEARVPGVGAYEGANG